MIKRHALLFGERTKSVLLFLANITVGKKVLYAHPDWVAMDWKSYKELIKQKPKFEFDGVFELEKEYKYKGEK
jgi:hypothetical protein